MAAQVDGDPISRVCAYCRTGIRSSALFTECTYCRLPYCISCRFEHQASHQRAVVTLRSIIHQFEVDGETEVCARCSNRVVFSYACCECDYILCRSCWFEQDINVHQHTIFNVIEPLRLAKSKAGVVDACCTVAAVNHCSTCSEPFSLGQAMIFCKSCYLQTNEPVYLCLRCYLSPEESHPRHHVSWQWTVAIAKPGGLARGIHCNDCLHTMGSVEELKAHPHTSYVDVYKEKHLDHVIVQSYRQCQKKAGRIDDMMAEASERCTVCLHKTVSSTFLPCQQCDGINRLCAHCGEYASKLHVHELPTGDWSGTLGPTSATVLYNIPVDSPPSYSVSLQPPQSPINVRTRFSPIPSPAVSPMSTASHQSPPLSPYRAIEPPWSRFYDEYDSYPIHGAGQYPPPQRQNVLHARSLSDPIAPLPRFHTPSGASQPYPRGTPHSRPAQHRRQLRPEDSSFQTSPPTSAEPNPARSRPRVPSQPSQWTHIPQPAPPTQPISLQPKSHRPSDNRPAQPPQPRQSSQSISPSLSTSPQPDPTHLSHSKPVQPANPGQSTRPGYPTPPTSYEQDPTHTSPSGSAQPPHPTQHPQPAAPTEPDTPTAPPITRLSSAPEVLVSTPEHPVSALEHPQEEAVTKPKRAKFAGHLKKAYGATQKKAATRIATRVVAKTAFSAVSNVIGADLGGVVDGLGGMNLGGTGINAGSLVGRAVTSAADAVFDETIGEGDHGRHGKDGKQVGGGGKISN